MAGIIGYCLIALSITGCVAVSASCWWELVRATFTQELTLRLRLRGNSSWREALTSLTYIAILSPFLAGSVAIWTVFVPGILLPAVFG